MEKNKINFHGKNNINFNRKTNKIYFNGKKTHFNGEKN